MQHNWQQELFETGVDWDGFKTCVETWSCRICGERQRVPLGDKPHSTRSCEDKRKLMETIQAFKDNAPKSWGNGRKARGGRDVTRQ
jgi:hypothetical protein